MGKLVTYIYTRAGARKESDRIRHQAIRLLVLRNRNRFIELYQAEKRKLERTATNFKSSNGTIAWCRAKQQLSRELHAEYTEIRLGLKEEARIGVK